jgi:hypothetical protein
MLLAMKRSNRFPVPLQRAVLIAAVLAPSSGACAPFLSPTAPTAAHARAVPAPADVIGFDPGEDRKLADYGQLLAYYEALAAASDRAVLLEIGHSTQGRPMVLLALSSAENLERLDEWQSISRRLGRATGLGDGEARELAREGKVIVWIDAGLHSTEVATAQHAPHLAFHLAADESEETRRIRDEVVVLLMPMMNPDGHEIVVDWYRGKVGTPYETTSPPRLYHEYVGHDINRDWYMFRQQETRVVGRILYEEWLPQIVFNHHQTAPFPARIFIPPFADPINPRIDPRVVRGVNLVGEHMAHRFEMEGMPGVISGTTFTMWWNGGMRTAPYFHNQIGILSEVGHASPTPRYHDPAEFPDVFAGGVPTLEPTVRYPNPWRGGRASLGDAVRYHLVASLGALDMAQKNRENLLYAFYEMGRDAIRAGEAGDPYAYIISLEEQHDPGEALELVAALRRGGIEVGRATAPFFAGGSAYPAGSYVLRAGQAFRAHLLDLLEPQHHPARALYPGGPPEPPYGSLTGYTLSIQMGVNAVRIDTPFAVETESLEGLPAPEGRLSGAGDVFLLEPRENRVVTAVASLVALGAGVRRSTASFEHQGRGFPAGTLVAEPGRAPGGAAAIEVAVRAAGVAAHRSADAPAVASRPVVPRRIGIYRPWTANIDAGWTRWLLDHYGVPYRTVTDEELRGGALADLDVLVLASQSAEGLMRGHRAGAMPLEYTGGIGEEGVAALRSWVEGGGRVVALDEANDFLLYHFDVPVGNALAGLSPREFYVPGSLVRIDVDRDHPLAFGMQSTAGAFFQNSRAFDIGGTGPEAIARYGREGLLLSGWEIGAEEYLSGTAAMVRAPYGEGDLVLIGFRAQFRGQPAGTFKLLFNALLYPD